MTRPIPMKKPKTYPSTLVSLFRPLYEQFTAAAELRELSAAEWLSGAGVMRHLGELDMEGIVDWHTRPDRGTRYPFHMRASQDLIAQLKLVAAEAGESMSTYLRKAGQARLVIEGGGEP